MALSDKAQALLKQIYAHRYQVRGWGELVDEDPDEALEYVLQEITDTLTDRHHNAAPLDTVMESAVGRLRTARRERHEVKTS